MSDENVAERIGLIAGWGHYPIVVAKTLKRQGKQVICLGIKGHANRQLGEICDEFRLVGIAKTGAQIRHFRRRQVSCATMAGKIFKHRLLFHGIGWVRHLPDWRCIKMAYPFFWSKTKDRKDDTMLGAFVDEFAKDGILFAPATNFAPELLVKSGTLSKRAPTESERKDILFGWHLAKEIGRLDIGQSVAVKGQAVLAVEAIEGTDKCIQRAGQLCPQGGFTVVKVAKPQQDMRFDVPTIGIGTLETLVAAGGRVLAVEADKTIVIDELAVIQYANRHRLTIIAFDQADLAALSKVA